MDVTELFIKAGFTPYDILIMYFGPLFSAFGGIAHAILIDQDWEKIPPLEFTDVPKKEQKRLKISWHSSNARMGWILGRLLLGGVVGFGIALFFLGSLAHEVTAIAKVFLVCLIAGLAAPKLLNHIDKQAVKRLEAYFKGNARGEK